MAVKPSNVERGGTVTTAHPLVLASASPRRSEILHRFGFRFTVVPSEVDEDSVQEPAAEQLAVKLAERKAEAVSRLRPGTCVIAADTVVELERESLGKPLGPADAVSMLKRLSGRTHSVLTGLAIAVNGVTRSGVETTRVRMRDLRQSEIEGYVDSGAAMDKAGAYGIQDKPFSPVESISGSYLNVVGLPVAMLARLLLAAGEISENAAESLIRRDQA